MAPPTPPATRAGVTFIGSQAGSYSPRELSAPNRGVLHMTDVVASNLRAMAAAHDNPPHDWWDRRDPGVVYQTIPYSNNARALLSVAGIETNHRGYCYQLEMNDRAVDGDRYTDRDLENLAHAVIVPISRLFGLPLVAYRDRGEQSDKGYGSGSITRMSSTEWLTATRADGTPWGWCLHQNVPGQSHWDGPIAMGRLMAISREIDQDATEENDVDPMLIRKGYEKYGKDPASTEFVRASLALLGFNPGPSGQRIDEAIVRFKRRHMDATADAKPTVGEPFWRRLVAEVALIDTREPAIVEVPDPKAAQTIAQLEQDLRATEAERARLAGVRDAVRAAVR
jgi:hypothetical protein